MKNYGFVEPIITSDQYNVLGGSPFPKIVTNEKGDWRKFIPEFETQVKQVDTYNCTAFGTTNALEIYKYAIRTESENYSDRFLGIMAGTYPPGNDPHTVAETARNCGLIKESLLPFDDNISTVDEYYAPVSEKLKAEGLKWKQIWDFKHTWVITDKTPHKEKRRLIEEYLKYSPLGVSVYGWVSDEKGIYYKPEGQIDNHWCTLVAINERGNYVIFDSYDNSIKELSGDYSFTYVKCYSLIPKVSDPKYYEDNGITPSNWLKEFIDILINFLKNLCRI